jgi:hypothetical protein
MMSKEKQAPDPYTENGQGFIGEGRGAPQAPINSPKKEPAESEEKKK